MSNILTYFLPILVITLTYYVQYKIDHSDSEPKRKSRRAIAFYILSVGLLLMTTFNQYKDELQDIEAEYNLQSKLDTISKENKKLQSLYYETRDSLTIEINDLEDTLNSSSKKIFRLYGNIYDQSNFIQKSLYGEGMAFITRGPTIVDTLYNYITSFYIQNLSNFPIYNFTITIYDYEYLMKKAKKYYGSTEKYIYSTDYNASIRFVIGPIDLNPSELYRSDFMPEDILTRMSLAMITARNGVYYQKIIQYYDEEFKDWFYAYQLLDSSLNILETKLHNGYFDEYINPQLLEKLNSIDIKESKDLSIQTEQGLDSY